MEVPVHHINTCRCDHPYRHGHYVLMSLCVCVCVCVCVPPSVKCLLTFSILPLKCQLSGAVQAVFNLNGHSRTGFFCLGENVYLMGQHFLFCRLKVKPLQLQHPLFIQDHHSPFVLHHCHPILCKFIGHPTYRLASDSD
jgi:hypothetical protein